MRLKYLSRRPISAEQVLAIINEANAAYAEHKDGLKKAKNAYVRELNAAGIYVGSKISLLTSKSLTGQFVKVVDIKGLTIHVEDNTGKIWRCKGYALKDIKVEAKNEVD